ncbi:MAG: type I-C CRISPR-associated endonuclease Cas1 [Betaproteobacteria bacterium]|jgi:CRISPR-associated protein Cas1|nr:type I-C CRISPR-associated endonuclease Cas1 [Betaproteobacteria bacterium]MBK7516997.1 type I-C CRISPR-associated endonuclease Cas1 [Betaproteobacteria bacterium]MCU0939294.1 type I-C CRISPR-associated endonuclease Cas1c [Burkholderiaceae bacterium]
MQLLNTLYVTLPDSHLRLDNDTLRLLVGDDTRLRVPLHHLGAVVCFGHVSVSVPLMHRLADDGVALVLLDTDGRFKARLEGATAGNVLLRRAQHDTSQDAAFTLQLARHIVAGKLRNQRQVLLRGARDSKSDVDRKALTRHAQNLAASQRALPAAADLDAVRGVEGEAARGYFAALNHLVRTDLRDRFALDGRSRRPPRDRMNALLSFLYAMWMNDCRSACEAAGLDPQVGFLHALRPGRAALALDLMEEMRPLADRLALTLINRLEIAHGDFTEREGGAVMLEGDARKAVVVAFQERKREAMVHPLLAERVPLGLVPLVQARLLARHLRGEAAAYQPFATR